MEYNKKRQTFHRVCSLKMHWVSEYFTVDISKKNRLIWVFTVDAQKFTIFLFIHLNVNNVDFSWIYQKIIEYFVQVEILKKLIQIQIMWIFQDQTIIFCINEKGVSHNSFDFVPCGDHIQHLITPWSIYSENFSTRRNTFRKSCKIVDTFHDSL